MRDFGVCVLYTCSMYDCENCAENARKHSNQITHLNGKIRNLEEKVIELTKKCQLLYKHQSYSLQNVHESPMNMFEIDSQYCNAKDLHLPKFADYLEDLRAKYPILVPVLELFTSQSHNRKLKAHNTLTEWKIWSGFYRSYLADTFFRSRYPKSVMRTNLALGLYFTLVKIPDPAWRILERLRIVTSRETIENYVNSHPHIDISQLMCLIVSFNNCDFWKKVTHMRTCNQSEMVHVINWFIINFRGPASMPVGELYEGVNAAWFGEWVQNNDRDVQMFANLCLNRLIHHPPEIPLRFAYKNSTSYTKKSDFTVLPTEFNASTKSREDIKQMLAKIYEKYILGCTRTWLFVLGDEQVYAQLCNLKAEYPIKYTWMISILGEWC